jgi:2-(1,2-epoxy-1,2-dihydrophenyl)acetyl-CoA isomerase
VSADEPELVRELDEGVLRLVLNRPHAGNSFDTAMQHLLIESFEGASGDPDVRVVVLTAAGDRHFCTGPDLRDPQLAPDPDRVPGDAARRLREGSHRMVQAMLDCEKPIICGLNGTAAGAGANLVFAADLVVAAEGATIIELFTKRGLIPDGGAAYLLTRRLPPNVAKQLVFFAEPMTMFDAHRLGVVNEIVPAEKLYPTVAQWAERLASGPTRAYAASKQLLNLGADDGRDASFALEALLVEQIASTDDVAEGVAAFLEKREPRFRGR